MELLTQTGIKVLAHYILKNVDFSEEIILLSPEKRAAHFEKCIDEMLKITSMVDSKDQNIIQSNTMQLAKELTILIDEKLDKLDKEYNKLVLPKQ